MAQLLKVPLSTGGAGSQSAQGIRTPNSAIGFVGLTWDPIGAFTSHIQLEVLTNDAQIVTHFLAFRGRKSSTGFLPVTNATQLTWGIAVNAADAALTYNISAVFLVATLPGEPGQPLPAVPFIAQGGNDQIVLVTQTSVANTAQTLDVAPLGNVDGIQPLAAWFYNSGAGTATGNTGIFDGTTRADIDTTAVVAAYVFNLGAKGSQVTIMDTGLGVLWRTVVGAGGAGVTTTLYVVYRAVLLR